MNNELYTSGEYFEKHPSWHVEDSAWKAKNILRMLQRRQLQPKTVCEVGCGAGEILSQLHAQLSADVAFSGYEISPQAFELCQPRRRERLDFHLQDLLQDEGNLCFDLVLCIDVFEHVEDYLAFLRALKDKGRYKLFHIPLDLSVQTVWRCSPILKSRQGLGHIHYFTKELALAALQDSGYTVVDYFYTGTRLDLPSKSLRVNLAKLPRRVLYALHQDLAVRILGGFSLMVLTT